MIPGPPAEVTGGEGGNVLTADFIARAVGGTLVGDAAAVVIGVAPLERARSTDLTFLATPRLAAAFAECEAAVVLVSPELAESPGRPRARVIVADPQAALVTLLPRFADGARIPGRIHPSALLGRHVSLGQDVVVGPYAVIGDGVTLADRVVVDAHCVIAAGVRIGADTRLFSSVTVYGGSVLGERVIVHAGARIGCDGFGYVSRDGRHGKIPHVGRCVIGNDVEIGANTTIDRGSLGDTVVGDGTKIDNLVHIAHNCRIGRHCLFAAQVGLAGSVVVEDGSALGGQVGVADHQTIGAGARIAAQAGVFGSVPRNETWSGYPARPHREALRAQAAMFRLAPLMRRLERLLGREDAR